ncbi:MAG: hypothetical protein ACK5NN_11640 [Sphingomonadaceae bacterium]
MDDTGIRVLVLVGSIIAIALLAGLTAWLDLGRGERIRDTEHARELADIAFPGFQAVETGLDRAGYAAVLRDHKGRVLLLRRHGAHFAGRIIDSAARARLDQNFLTLETSDPHFGRVTLDLGPSAQRWAASFRNLVC